MLLAPDTIETMVGGRQPLEYAGGVDVAVLQTLHDMVNSSSLIGHQ
jgi:hypothetical protein